MVSDITFFRGKDMPLRHAQSVQSATARTKYAFKEDGMKWVE
jgi:hypothetical protein